ncbi:VanZ family protein [Streptomyces sp. NPDC014894]|uniref:VanZ family protein n=1 Tax=Streptomyces sp. NPDC014894 TaxID=3364931 RepID=UPI0037034562
MVVGAIALVGFSVVLARLTLTPSAASADIAGANLRPGRSLREYAENYTFLAACKQIGGNLLLGAPFGLILPVLVQRRMRMVRVVLLTAVVMALVELIQGALVEGRAFDVDDVFLNTGGALIAYLLLGRRIGHHFHALAGPPPGAREPGPPPAAQDPGPRPGAQDPGPPPGTPPEAVPAAPVAPAASDGPRPGDRAPGRGLMARLTRLRRDRPPAPRRP